MPVLAFIASTTVAGQQPPPPAAWTHYWVCWSTDSKEGPDRQLFDRLKDDLSAIVQQRGASIEPACVSSQALLDRVRQSASGRRITAVVDASAFRQLSATSAGQLLAQHGIRPVNPRLFTRPLHVFETADDGVRKNGKPTVGVYRDREILPAVLERAVAAVTGEPDVHVVPFDTIPELARCFERGSINPSSSGCPDTLTWAAILEQDVSTAAQSFRAEYQRLAGREPAPFQAFKLKPGVHGDNPDELVLVALPPDYPTLGTAGAGSGLLAAVPRKDGEEFGAQLEEEIRRNQTWTATILSYVRPNESGPLQYPFPVVLGSEGFPDASVRSALSDSYLRALSAWQTPPCTPLAERVHRAFLLNAYLENPQDKSTQLGLGSQLALARGGDLNGVLAQLKLTGDLQLWREALGAKPPLGAQCNAPASGTRHPKERVFFANPNLGSQYWAMDHLRAAAGASGEARRRLLNEAAVCLREALVKAAGPSCHASERSTYSFYYNPYFYFAVQQASGGRETK